MARRITLSAIRARDREVPPRLGVRTIAVFIVLQLLLLAALMFLFPARAGAAPVKSDVGVSTSGGYARLVFTLAEEVEADVRLANGIVIIQFKRPVDVAADRIALQANGYVAAARNDPDGTGIRLALNRKVTVNSMAAGEKLFVDLLPEGWTGLAPGLPQEVVEELARRAREAEKIARQRLQAQQQRALPALRVRVGAQPTFTRYTFPLPSLIPVSIDRADDKLSLTFDAPVRFDLADVQAALPPAIAAVEAVASQDSMVVRFDLIGKVDVRTFREDNTFNLDVQPLAPKAETNAKKPIEQAMIAAAQPRASEKPQPTPAAHQPSPAGPPQATAPVPATPAPAPDKPPEAQKPAPSVASPQPPPQASSPATAPARDTGDAKPAKPADGSDPVIADVRRQGETLRVTFPFAAPTPAAVFRRADTIWLVFDSPAPIDIAKVAAQSGELIRKASVTRSGAGQVVQLKLDRPKLTSIGSEGTTWTVVVGDMMLEPTQPLTFVRQMQNAGRASMAVPFQDPRGLHRLADPDIGDTLLVVTALGPARGFLRAQEFVEFGALTSTHGVVIAPRADDVTVELATDKLIVSRPGGLTLSNVQAMANVSQAHTEGGKRASAGSGETLDSQSWGFDRESNFRERQRDLITAAANTAETDRTAARLDLARFYLARDLNVEAKGVLDTILGDEQGKSDANVFLLRGIANIMLGRGADAMKDLTHPSIGTRGDAVLWRALAQAQQGKWVEARDGFRTIDAETAALPTELQRYAFQEAAHAAIEVRDFGTASTLLNEFDTLGPAPQRETDLAVLKGRVMEGLGRLAEALTFYRSAADSPDRPPAARARLREISLRQAVGEMKRPEATSALETLTIGWRGDETEAEALSLLGRYYAEDGRYRDAFQVMHTALTVYPNSDMTRRVQDEAAVAFDSLFLGNKGESLAPIDALSLFYDYRELTPIGRRGDEMIRKLADRLVAVDLLDQAAELLQHQVDNRLQGAARAQVAVRLAVIYLIARKPDRALQALRTSRTSDLPNELRNQRLMIEARALSDTGRADVALEVIANLQGREVERLRADVLWKARRWREAGEQIEKLYGERWREFAALTEPERADVMRAAIAYVLGEDKIGLDRLRTKYAPKMADGPDRRAFEVVTAPLATNAPEFADIARVVAATDTLEGFLRDIRTRYPETTGPLPGADGPDAQKPAAIPSRGADAATGRAG